MYSSILPVSTEYDRLIVHIKIFHFTSETNGGIEFGSKPIEIKNGLEKNSFYNHLRDVIYIIYMQGLAPLHDTFQTLFKLWKNE